MNIPCPYCGLRDLEEFSILGEVAPPRPDAEASDAIAQFHAYVHLRDNAFGPGEEHWYHANGCRRWVIVTRDTRDNVVLGARMAKP
jgi:sarcosine oxidase subunit delta